MFKKIICINIACILLATISFASIIKDIKINGNKRISKESIVVFGQIELDRDYDQGELNEILKKIYETNFFKKINFDIKNSILTISVIENPIIENLEINGI